MRRLQSRGFTIIELLIATVTFSLILLVITAAIIQFSKVYYKGVVTSKTQEVARSIADEVARSAQFSSKYSSSIGPTNKARCFGDRRFSYVLNEMPSSSQRSVVADTSASCTADLSALTSARRELLGENMQLLALDVITSGGGKEFTITVTVAYGNDTDMDSPNSPNASCKQLTLGGQFCAVSTVTSTVTRRLGNN